MISFFVCLVVLIVGFFTYGKIAEKVFGSFPCHDGRRGLCAYEHAEGLSHSAFEHRRPWPDIRRACRRVLGPKRISLDHIGHHFCRRSPRFYDRHDVYAA